MQSRLQNKPFLHGAISFFRVRSSVQALGGFGHQSPQPTRKWAKGEEPTRHRRAAKERSADLTETLADYDQALSKLGHRVLQPGSTMDLPYPFTSFQRHISRAEWWVGTSKLFVSSRVIAGHYSRCFPSTLWTHTRNSCPPSIFSSGYAVAAKRFQDRNKPSAMSVMS